MRNLHLTNADGRDATVVFSAAKPKAPPEKGLPDKQVRFKRYVAAAETGLHDALVQELGDDYAQALIDGDPEADLELIGRQIKKTDKVYLSAEGEVLYAAPKVIELLLEPGGAEKARRTPEDKAANVNETDPVRWTGKTFKRRKALQQFVFTRTLQLQHKDGLTYDYLYAMAKKLDEADDVVLIGAGAKGKDRLVFQQNGTENFAFLEGRVDGERYKLLLHLANMQLKAPAAD